MARQGQGRRNSENTEIVLCHNATADAPLYFQKDKKVQFEGWVPRTADFVVDTSQIAKLVLWLADEAKNLFPL